MSQVVKIDPSSATLHELADAAQLVDQGISSAEIKFEKKLYSLHPFRQILSFYIPRGIEMSITNGILSLDEWGSNHFLTNAEYFEEQGFKKGRYSHQHYTCPHRNEFVKATMDVMGRVVTVDDPEFSEMVEAVKAFPPAAYREANNSIIEIIHKYIIESAASINLLEPFGAIIFLQQSITWNLAKVCIDSSEEIRNNVHRVERLPHTNRQEVSKFQKEAIFALTMQEKSKLVPVGYFDNNFWYNALTAWQESADNLPDPQKARVNRTVEYLMGEIDAKERVSRDATFGIMRDRFRTTVSSLSQVDGQDIGLPPPQLALVASTVQAPHGQKRKNLQQALQKDIPETLALLLKGQGDLKAEMGAMRELMKILSAGQNGINPINPKRPRTQQETGKPVKAFTAAVVRKNQGKPARHVQVAKELPTVMDSSGSQESEEEVIYANYATSVYKLPQQQLASINGPASGRAVVYSVTRMDLAGRAPVGRPRLPTEDLARETLRRTVPHPPPRTL